MAQETERSEESNLGDTQVSGAPVRKKSERISATRLAPIRRVASPDVCPPDSSPGCLDEDTVLAYCAGKCSEATLQKIDPHLDACDRCQQLVLLYNEQDDASDNVEQEEAHSNWPKAFARGDVVNARYEIRRFIGRGGMGEVYEAHDRLMDARIALKTIIPTVNDRQRAVRKLTEEVRNALRVGHPNVCRINELQEHREEGGSEPAVPFFTMEFIEGERLGQRLERGAVGLQQAQRIAIQLLEGLRAAHDRGVLHLDFKCDNVMLRNNSDGDLDAVIMDFGLSKALEESPHERTSERLQWAGTLPYMSVEQLDCRGDVGPTADIYAFGVVLYKLLTGRLPHVAESLSSMLIRQLNDTPQAPSHYCPEVAPALDRFVLRCLDKIPSLRFSNAAEALEKLGSIGSWQAEPRRRRLLRAVPSVATVAAIVTLMSFQTCEGQPPDSIDASAVAKPAAASVPDQQLPIRNPTRRVDFGPKPLLPLGPGQPTPPPAKPEAKVAASRGNRSRASRQASRAPKAQLTSPKNAREQKPVRSFLPARRAKPAAVSPPNRDKSRWDRSQLPPLMPLPPRAPAPSLAPRTEPLPNPETSD